jgi:hypothetical protein
MFDNAFADWKDAQFGKVTSIRCIIKSACMHKYRIEKSTSVAEIRGLLARSSIVQPPEWFQAMLTQGVLLLNASLTASSDDAMSTSRHTGFWKPVVERIVHEILKAKAETGQGVVFAWWGTHAKALRSMVEKLAARFPEVPVRHVDHCNPAAQGDAFCEGDHFGDINAAVQSLEMQPIDWLPAHGWNAGATAHEQADARRLGDFIEKTRELHQLYLERLQGVGDEQLEELPRISGVMALPPATLADATAPLVALFPALGFYAKKSHEFAEKMRREAPALSVHEIGALFLYTTESVLYRQLNAVLRDPDRTRATPWLSYLRLFLSAVSKLGMRTESLWRGVAKDLRGEYPMGRVVTWWGVSSCTPSLQVARGFLGAKGRRMLFEVAPRSAVSIKSFSAFTGEDEYVLAPGARLKVVGVTAEPDGLVHVRLEELAEERLVA